MKLNKIEIARFRNLENIHVRPSSGMTGFWGENGQGKTNILEAVFAALSGKSFRPYSNKSDWLPNQRNPSEHEENFLGPIKVEIQSDRGQDFQIKCFSSSQASKRIQVELNDKKSRFANVRTLIPIVVFSPDDHSLIRQSPEIRRLFLDEILSDVVPGYLEILDRFERTLKNRNKILRAHQERGQMIPSSELKAFTELYLAASLDLFNIRMDIWPKFREKYLEISKGLFEKTTIPLEIHYEADFLESTRKELSFSDQLKKSWDCDLATGWTHRGPHRDDLSIRINDLDAKAKASQGQARLLALGLKWTHAMWVLEERREKPLFLIDDFSSELDAKHRSRLLDMLKELSCQVFISGTDPSLVDFQSISDYTHYRVESGRISPL